MDYFEVFGLPHSLTLDGKALQKRFYELSRQYHPDGFASASVLERRNAEEASAELNDAYRTLRDPVRRAEYLLKLNGFEMGEQRGSDVPPELLEEAFELNMALEELREGGPGADTSIEEARAKFTAMRDAIDRELDSLAAVHDAAPGRETLQQVRGLLNRRRYIGNLVSQTAKPAIA